MTDWGVSAGYHDAALSVIKDGKIVFAGHAERYSRKKNDKSLNAGLINDALHFGEPDQIFWFESRLSYLVLLFLVACLLPKLSHHSHLTPRLVQCALRKTR